MKMSKDALMSAFEKMLSQFPEAVENETLDAEGTEPEEMEEEGMEEEEDSMEVEVPMKGGKKPGLADYMRKMM
jgi:hypothetical protein